ncbi:hypothetical protein GCM10027063_12960 [Promicromonospora xylanilytica]
MSSTENPLKLRSVVTIVSSFRRSGCTADSGSHGNSSDWPVPDRTLAAPLLVGSITGLDRGVDGAES